LALANQVQAAQPQFQDTTIPGASVGRAPARIDNPPHTRPVERPEPAQANAPANVPVNAPADSPAAPTTAAEREIGAGSTFVLTSQQKLCTSSNRPGDRFAASVTRPVIGSNGAVVPAGATMDLEVASVDAGSSAMAVRVVSVEFNGVSYRVSGDAVVQGPFERSRIMSDPNADKKKVIGGVIAGAIIGQLLGHNTKGTVIGAAAGGATGAVVAKAGEKYESCVPIGAGIRVTLDRALVL
jgi:hypothetical protein